MTATQQDHGPRELSTLTSEDVRSVRHLDYFGRRQLVVAWRVARLTRSRRFDAAEIVEMANRYNFPEFYAVGTDAR